MFDRRRPDPALGVFETMLVVDGHPVDLDAHLGRLESSLETLFPNRTPPDLSRLDVPSESGRYGSDGTSAEGGGDALHSLRVTVAPDFHGELEARTEMRAAPPGAFTPPADGGAAPAGISLHSFSLPGGLGAHKWADRSLLDEAQAGLPDDALPLLVDADGSVLEASRANVFAVRGGCLFTPSADGRILPGITRMRLIETAAARGIEAREAELQLDDLLTADEVFLSGSVRGVERVRSLDGTALDGGGEIAAKLAADLGRTWVAAQVG